MLHVNALCKSYAAPVLRDVEMHFAPGEVHAIVGANGAGKTTLCNILCGITVADEGVMRLHESDYRPESINDAKAVGIRIVTQELNLIDDLSVAENIYFTNLPSSRGLIDFEQLYSKADSELAKFGMRGIDPRTKVSRLGIGHKQLLEIARVLADPCDVLVLDEPTATLTDPQIDLLFEKIEMMRAAGTSIIYVSHRMGEIRRISNRVSVLRDGAVACTAPTDDLTVDDIVRHMAGDLAISLPRRMAPIDQKPALSVRGLCTRDLLKGINLDICSGEILGIAGLVGAGRTELLRAIFGADRMSAGSISLANDRQPLSIKCPGDAVSHGIGLVPEDRKQQGLLMEQSVANNISLPALARFAAFGGWVDRNAENERVDHFVETLDIKCDRSSQTVRELSGGNQQKVSIARWLLKDCEILLFDEPTRGVDIHAKTAIYALLLKLAEEGKAIVVVSSESRELTDLCDRIAVLSAGRLAAVFPRGEWTAEKIMAASFSAFVRDDPGQPKAGHAT